MVRIPHPEAWLWYILGKYGGKTLPGAILTRIASSHIRVGTFQYAANWGTSKMLNLVDYSIQRHFPT